MLHGDLHRRNVIIKRAKRPFSKTYYINNSKYKIGNQLYKATLVDFDCCKEASSTNCMDDIKYICSFFENKFEFMEDFETFFEANFDAYKVS